MNPPAKTLIGRPSQRETGRKVAERGHDKFLAVRLRAHHSPTVAPASMPIPGALRRAEALACGGAESASDARHAMQHRYRYGPLQRNINERRPLRLLLLLVTGLSEGEEGEDAKGRTHHILLLASDVPAARHDGPTRVLDEGTHDEVRAHGLSVSTRRTQISPPKENAATGAQCRVSRRGGRGDCLRCAHDALGGRARTVGSMTSVNSP